MYQTSATTFSPPAVDIPRDEHCFEASYHPTLLLNHDPIPTHPIPVSPAFSNYTFISSDSSPHIRASSEQCSGRLMHPPNRFKSMTSFLPPGTQPYAFQKSTTQRNSVNLTFQGNKAKRSRASSSSWSILTSCPSSHSLQFFSRRFWKVCGFYCPFCFISLCIVSQWQTGFSNSRNEAPIFTWNIYSTSQNAA